MLQVFKLKVDEENVNFFKIFFLTFKLQASAKALNGRTFHQSFLNRFCLEK
jgi:hypothetical protein